MKRPGLDHWMEGTIIVVLMLSASVLEQWNHGIGAMTAGVTGISWALAKRAWYQKQAAAFAKVIKEAFYGGYEAGWKGCATKANKMVENLRERVMKEYTEGILTERDVAATEDLAQQMEEIDA